jgi:hypothetical protein
MVPFTSVSYLSAAGKLDPIVRREHALRAASGDLPLQGSPD